MASSSASRAWAIDAPCIEPEVSMTKIASRGMAGPRPSITGGTTMSSP